MAYVHIPVDFEAPSPQHFRFFGGVMKAFDERPELVHCVPRAEAGVDLHALWQPAEVWSRFIQERLSDGRVDPE
ncbi:MAG: hypothetical protein ACI9OD_002953 [Limisphaerales bacterium]|jgi:hypothetical protein